ncbi:MAG: hypothetical protein RL033_5736, partial [Pseudomonadota bacterium]
MPRHTARSWAPASFGLALITALADGCSLLVDFDNSQAALTPGGAGGTPPSGSNGGDSGAGNAGAGQAGAGNAGGSNSGADNAGAGNAGAGNAGAGDGSAGPYLAFIEDPDEDLAR